MAHKPKTRMDIPGRREAHEKQRQQNAERQRKLDELHATHQRKQPLKQEPAQVVLLTVSEAARQLSISVATLRNWISTSLVQVVRYPTGTMRVPQSSVDSLKNSLNFYQQESNSRQSGGSEA